MSTSPNPLILDDQGADLQHAEKTKRNAISGLRCMGLVFLFFGNVFAIAIYSALQRGGGGRLFDLFIILFFFACGICYMDCARMIRKDSYPAAIVALFVTSLQAICSIGITLFFGFALSLHLALDKYLIPIGILICLLIALTVFSIAMAIEVRKVYRHLRSQHADTSEPRP